MERSRAVELVGDVLRRLIEEQDEWPLSLVREVYVFGSFARGALQPGDVDLDVEIERDQRWANWFVNAMSAGHDPYVRLRQPLVGRKRLVQLMFGGHEDADFPMTLLWRRGDDLDLALSRLNEIKPDPEAGRAERDAMLPQFEGLDRWLPRWHREHFISAIDTGAITVERVTLPDAEPRHLSHPVVEEHLWGRWQPTSPLYRAAGAVFGYLIDRGIDPSQLHLHGKDVRAGDTPYYAGFSLRYLRAMQWCFTDYAGREWIEVVHPTRTGAIYGLRVLPRSIPKLKELHWMRS